MPQVRRRETLHPRDVRGRLKQLGATEQRKYTNATRQIWHSRRHDTWIQVTTNRQGNTDLKFYDSCPCSS